MSNIKGLYFKLNKDNSCDNEILEFFNYMTKEYNLTKITLLYMLVKNYMATVKEDEWEDKNEW